MKTLSYYFLVLDIETSTLQFHEDEPVATWLSYGYCNLYDVNGDRAETTYFRDWGVLRKYLLKISQRFINNKILCFVHNLAYEFDYLLKNISKPKTLLTNSSHGVIYSILEDFPQIEFRCTFKISMTSLEKIGLSLGFNKLHSDYRFITPLDDVTEEEKKYCIRDCDVTAKYVLSLFNEFKGLSKIPYTKTGRVRNTFKQFYAEKYSKENPCDWDFMPDEDCYDALVDSFAGGLVLSNPIFTGRIMKDAVSYDITSSYPFAMLSEKFPYKITREYHFSEKMMEEDFWIAKIKFYGISTKYSWQWLSSAKMNDFCPVSTRLYNGKLIDSNFIVRTVTNIDFEMISKTYNYESFEVLEFYHLDEYGQLPYPYIQTIKYYGEIKQKRKKEFKEISKNYSSESVEYRESERLYMLSKNDFNSIYGMCVQKLMPEEFEIDEFNVWHEKKQTYKKNPKKHMKRNFIFGIYITAYARRNLLNAIITNCPDSFCYCDTDSVKFIGGGEFVNTNKPLPDEFKQIPALSSIGSFDFDGKYDRFVTYGAKKYCYEEDGETRMTVAGLPKYQKEDSKMFCKYRGAPADILTPQKQLRQIEYFRVGTEFCKCKLAKKYLTSEYLVDVDEQERVTNVSEVDEQTIYYLKKHKIETGGGVALFSVSYNLDITEVDKNYIYRMQNLLPAFIRNHQNLKPYIGGELLL